MTARLDRAFYRRDPVTVARALLGQRLVSVVGGERVAGLIVEVEAYLGERDAAAHSFGGRRTARTETMFGDGGVAYVYLNYGLHQMVNVVAGRVGEPVAVLLRGVEPTEGLDLMWGRREKAKTVEDLCSGPGKLGAAFGVCVASHDGADLVAGEGLWVERVRQRAYASGRVGVGPRVGVGYAGAWASAPLRFWVKGNAHVSRG